MCKLCKICNGGGNRSVEAIATEKSLDISINTNSCSSAREKINLTSSGESKDFQCLKEFLPISC